MKIFILSDKCDVYYRSNRIIVMYIVHIARRVIIFCVAIKCMRPK